MLRQTVVSGIIQPVGQIEGWAAKFDPPATLRPASNVTGDVVITDQEPFDVDALDVFAVRCERERKFSIEACRLHIDLAQPSNLLVGEIEDQSAAARNIGGLLPACLRNGQACRVKVEPGIG